MPSLTMRLPCREETNGVESYQPVITPLEPKHRLSRTSFMYVLKAHLWIYAWKYVQYLPHKGVFQRKLYFTNGTHGAYLKIAHVKLLHFRSAL